MTPKDILNMRTEYIKHFYMLPDTLWLTTSDFDDLLDNHTSGVMGDRIFGMGIKLGDKTRCGININILTKPE